MLECWKKREKKTLKDNFDLQAKYRDDDNVNGERCR